MLAPIQPWEVERLRLEVVVKSAEEATGDMKNVSQDDWEVDDLAENVAVLEVHQASEAAVMEDLVEESEGEVEDEDEGEGSEEEEAASGEDQKRIKRKKPRKKETKKFSNKINSLYFYPGDPIRSVNQRKKPEEDGLRRLQPAHL